VFSISRLFTGQNITGRSGIGTTELMVGCAFTYTPTVTGHIRINIAGIAMNTAGGAGAGTTITGRYGTGTPPAAGAALTGTQYGVIQHIFLPNLAQVGFMIMDIPTTFTVGMAYWFDLSVVSTSGAGAGVKDIQFTLLEL
jgi:hypothetical protein